MINQLSSNIKRSPKPGDLLYQILIESGINTTDIPGLNGLESISLFIPIPLLNFLLPQQEHYLFDVGNKKNHLFRSKHCQ